MTARRVAVLGSGGVALGSAALLASSGHTPVLWSHSGVASGMLDAAGALQLRQDVAVTADCARAVAGVDVVLRDCPNFCV